MCETEVLGGVGIVHEIVVHPRYRGEGVGSLLMREAERQLKSRGVRVVELSVKTTNKQAIKFYHRLGYSALHRVLSMSGDIHSIRVEKPSGDFIFRSLNPREDLKKIASFQPTVWWDRSLRSLQLFPSRNNTIVERDGSLLAFIQTDFDGEADVYSLRIASEASPSVLIRALIWAVKNQTMGYRIRRIYVDLDEPLKDVVKVLKGMGFKVYDVEYMMRKHLNVHSRIKYN